MTYLYLILNIGTIIIPLIYSIYEKKFHFVQYVKIAFISIITIAIPFIIWDALFTKIGVWGFNEKYHLPFKIMGMPIEEWLFFICIPYACLFTHEGFKYYFSDFKLSFPLTKTISYTLLIVIMILLLLNFGKLYTTINFIWFTFLMVISIKKYLKKLQTYYLTFWMILIPFFIVNGILTGSFIDGEVVWYNNDENMNVRLCTIPIEDIFYAFNLLFSIQLVFDNLKDKNYEK